MNTFAPVLALPGFWGLAVLAYFAGSIPFGLLLARTFAKVDVREQGSGNIGATNVARVVGKKLGIVTLLLDVAKAALPALLAAWLPLSTANELAVARGTLGLCAFCGHCFPIWLRFRGGKGVASGLGVMLVISPSTAALALLLFAVTFAVFRLASLASLVATGGATVALFWMVADPIVAMPMVVCSLIVIGKHHENLRRLWQHNELRV